MNKVFPQEKTLFIADCDSLLAGLFSCRGVMPDSLPATENKLGCGASWETGATESDRLLKSPELAGRSLA